MDRYCLGSMSRCNIPVLSGGSGSTGPGGDVIGHLESVNGQVTSQRRRGLPANDSSREDIYDKVHIGPSIVGLALG